MPRPTQPKYSCRLFINGEYTEFLVPCLNDINSSLHPYLDLSRGVKEHLCHRWDDELQRYVCKAKGKGQAKYAWLHIRKLRPTMHTIQGDTSAFTIPAIIPSPTNPTPPTPTVTA